MSLDGTPVSLSLPVTLGISLADYYEGPLGQDDRFGYLDIGLVASTELPIPESYGTWEISAGAQLQGLRVSSGLRLPGRWCAVTSVRRGPGHRDGRRGMIST